MFGVIPAYGFYVRHASGITFDNVEVSFEKDEARPAFILDDVKNVQFFRTNAELFGGAKMFVLRNVTGFSVQQSRNVEDTKISKTAKQEF